MSDGHAAPRGGTAARRAAKGVDPVEAAATVAVRPLIGQRPEDVLEALVARLP